MNLCNKNVAIIWRSDLSLAAYLVPVTHEVMDGDQALVDDNPAGVESPLKQQISQSRYGYIGLICTLQQI